MLELLRLAAEYSAPQSRGERIYLLGAVGVRNDGRMVHARNEAVLDTFTREKWGTFSIYKRFPEAHAEVRLTRKLGFNATVYVSRVMKGSKDLAMARPCEVCQGVLRAFRVKKVYYTISNNEWGVWNPTNNTDVYYSK